MFVYFFFFFLLLGIQKQYQTLGKVIHDETKNKRMHYYFYPTI